VNVFCEQLLTDLLILNFFWVINNKNNL